MTLPTRFFPRALLLACGLTIGLMASAQAAQPPAARSVDQAPKNQLVGPMVGTVNMRSARVWLQLQSLPRGAEVPAWLEFQPEASSDARLVEKSPSVRLTPDQNAAVLVLDQLEPGTRYRYRARWGHGRAAQTSAWYNLTTEALWQWRADPPPLRVVAGSCAYTNDPASDRPGQAYGRSTGIFQSMAQRKPDVTLWMGDNIYLREPDFDDRSAMARRYDQWRALPDLQPLLQQGRHLATWDDHDFGPNDSNASNITKDISLDLFKQYWANPSYGIAGLPGVFTQTRASDVEFFFLDGRWYRDSDKLADDDRAMLGAGQLRWLQNALTASTATWKLVVSGSQILNLRNGYEGWHKFPKEQQAFLNWLEQAKNPGGYADVGGPPFLHPAQTGPPRQLSAA